MDVKKEVLLVLVLVLLTVAFSAAPRQFEGSMVVLPYVVGLSLLFMTISGVRYTLGGRWQDGLRTGIALLMAVAVASFAYLMVGGGIMFPLGLLVCGVLYLYLIDIPVRQMRQRWADKTKKIG
jgi:hypothetical protein